ncbi:MAG: MFS transporter [Armatimonadetes bacterium]|nr:MFS transporter [Armatimonadota bacterium]
MFSRRPTDRETGIEGAKGNLRRAFSLSVAYMVAFNIASPMLPLYLTAKGASPALVGAVLASSSVMPLLLGVSLGALVVVHGASRVSLASAILFAIATALFIPEPSPLWTAILFGLVNVGHLGMMIATQATVAGWSTLEERAAVYGQYTFWVSAGNVAGPILGGVVAERFGFGAAFAAMFGVSLVAIVAALRIADRPGGLPTGVTLATAYRAAFSLARDDGVAVILFISFLVVGAQSLQITFYPLLLQKGGLTAERIGVLVAILNFASMIVRPFLGVGVRRLGYAAILIGGNLVGAASYLLAIKAGSFAPHVGAAVVMGIAMGFIQPLTMSLMASSVAPPMLGLAMSARLTIQRLSLILGPLIFGFVVAATSVDVSFQAGAAILTTVALIVWRRAASLNRSRPVAAPRLETARSDSRIRS